MRHFRGAVPRERADTMRTRIIQRKDRAVCLDPRCSRRGNASGGLLDPGTSAALAAKAPLAARRQHVRSFPARHGAELVPGAWRERLFRRDRLLSLLRNWEMVHASRPGSSDQGIRYYGYGIQVSLGRCQSGTLAGLGHCIGWQGKPKKPVAGVPVHALTMKNGG